MQTYAYILLTIAGVITAYNFYLSWIRYPLHQVLRAGESFRFVSGLPMIGFVLLCLATLAFINAAGVPPYKMIIILAILDTGGPVGLLLSLLIAAGKRRDGA